MTKLLIEYPETLPDSLQETRETFEKEAKMAMVAKLYELKKISSGIAAKMLGLDRVSFLLELKNYNVPMIDITDEELMSDIENA